MAQLLVMHHDNTHPDPARDRAGCYKTGDVVCVVPDEHVFSARELAEFRVVSAPGPVADWAYLTESEPASLRHRYPRALLAIRRLHRQLGRDIRGDIAQRRRNTINLDDTVTRKPAEVL